MLLDFFHGGVPPDISASDVSTLSTAFLFLFMEPAGNSKAAGDRIRVMSKLVSMAMGVAGRVLLHCAGVWMHQQVRTVISRKYSFKF